MDEFFIVYVFLFFPLFGTAIVSSLAITEYRWHRTTATAILIGGLCGAFLGTSGILVGAIVSALVGYFVEHEGVFAAGIVAGCLSAALAAHAVRMYASGSTMYLISFTGFGIFCILSEIFISSILYNREHETAQSTS